MALDLQPVLDLQPIEDEGPSLEQPSFWKSTPSQKLAQIENLPLIGSAIEKLVGPPVIDTKQPLVNQGVIPSLLQGAFGKPTGEPGVLTSSPAMLIGEPQSGTAAVIKKIAEQVNPMNILLGGQLSALHGVKDATTAQNLLKTAIATYFAKQGVETGSAAAGELTAGLSQPKIEPSGSFIPNVSFKVNKSAVPSGVRQGELGADILFGAGMAAAPLALRETPKPPSGITGGDIERSTNLTPQDVDEIAGLEPRKYYPRASQEVPPIVGERPITIGQQIVPPTEARPVEPSEIIPARQAAGEPKEGGKISFAAPAEAEAVPSARQTGVEQIQRVGNIPPNEPIEVGVSGGVGGRGGVSERIIPKEEEISQFGNVSGALREGNAIDLQHSLESSTLDTESLRRFDSLDKESASSIDTALRYASLRGLSNRELADAAIALFDNQKRTGKASNTLSADEIESIVGKKVGSPKKGAQEKTTNIAETQTGKTERSIYAGTYRSPEEVHVGVLPQSKIYEGQVPTQKGVEGVQPQTQAGVPQAVSPVAEFQAEIDKPKFEATNKFSSRIGLALKSLDDLEGLKRIRLQLDQERKALFEQAKAEPDQKKQFDLIQQSTIKAFKGQLAREAIETATNTGSWIEGEGSIPHQLGERPLDWKKNPQVRDWMQQNAKAIGTSFEQPIESRGAAGGNLSTFGLFDPANYRPALDLASELFDIGKDKFDDFARRASGAAAPMTSKASTESGNSLVRYASANQAAPYLARAMTDEVLRENRNNEPFRKKLGAVLVEDRLRAIKQGFQTALTAARDPREIADLTAKLNNVNSLIGAGKPFADEAAFRAALADPQIQGAIARHKAVVQRAAEMFHSETGGQLAGAGVHTGAFVNLEPLQEEMPELVFGRGTRGDYSRPFKKRSVFGQRATGSAAEYQLDYDRMAERMIRGNYEEYSKRQLYDQLERDGLAMALPPGVARPNLGEKPAVKFQIERRGQPGGGTKIENLWVRADVAPELRQALNIEGAIQQAGLARVADVLNRVQLAGPTDAIWHSANILGSIAGQQGGKNFLVDLARKIPGVNIADASIRVTMKAREILKNDPAINKELSDLAVIGATRPEGVTHGGLMNRMITLLDKAGRLVRNDLYDNLVQRGLTRESEAGRREFVNQVGNYNPRLMGQFQRFFKEAGFSPFIVAGRNFNRLALRRMTMNPGFESATKTAAVKARTAELFGVLATLSAVPALINSISVGKPLGRPGVQYGQIDTGKTDSKGNPIVIDPAQWIGLRRGMRITGINAAINGMMQHKPGKEIQYDAGRDIINAITHPWAGPAVQAPVITATGKTTSGFKESDKPNDYWENFKAALKNMNPIAHAFFKDKEKTFVGTAENIGTSLGGAVGVKTAHRETPYNDIKNRATSWGLSSPNAKIKKLYEQNQQRQLPESNYKPLRQALEGNDREKIVNEVRELVNLEDTKEKKSKRMKEILKEFQPFNEKDVKPFATRSKEMEVPFVRSLDNEGKAEYRAAIRDQVEQYRRLTAALYGRPQNPPVPEAYRKAFVE